MKIYLLFFVSIITVSSFLLPAGVFACSYAPDDDGNFTIPPTTPQGSFDSHTAVFVGKVISVQSIGKDREYGDKEFIFEVSKYWKGNVSEKTKVITMNDTAGCQMPYYFKEGKEYLVYASYDKSYDAFRVQGSDFGETATRPLENAETHLDFLGPGKIPQNPLMRLTTLFWFISGVFVIWLYIKIKGRNKTIV